MVREYREDTFGYVRPIIGGDELAAPPAASDGGRCPIIERFLAADSGPQRSPLKRVGHPAQRFQSLVRVPVILMFLVCVAIAIWMHWK